MSAATVTALVVLGYVVFSAALWAITWVVYLAGMGIVRAEPVLYGLPAKLVKPVQWLAGFLSTALNWLVFTTVLLELPKERFLSTRLARHVRTGAGWRHQVAMWMGRNWLDPFDPNGTHIGASNHA